MTTTGSSRDPAPTPEAVARDLGGVRERLRGHGGDVNVASVGQDGSVELEFVGACRGCPALAFTFTTVVVPAVQALPGVTRVTSRQARFSRFVAARVSALATARDGDRRHGDCSGRVA